MKRRPLLWLGFTAIAVLLSILAHAVLQPGGAVFSEQASVLAQEQAPEPSFPAVVGTYEDSQGTFQVGILQGFAVSSAAGSPLFEQEDGSLAYSVVRVPLSSEAPLSDIGLVELAEDTLGQGEGFQTQTFSPMPDSGLQITWTGRFTQGNAPSQPVTGTLWIKQQEGTAYLLVVAALEPASDQVPAVISILAESLTIL